MITVKMVLTMMMKKLMIRGVVLRVKGECSGHHVYQEWVHLPLPTVSHSSDSSITATACT